MLDVLDGAALARVVASYRDALRAHQEELNRLNVYPVPDGDTGTNMTLTLESVCAELGSAERMDDVCQAVAHGSLMGARGNSGVILSQILRGFAEVFADRQAVTTEDLVTALRRGADAAYDAVVRPVEGTILTVVRAAAEAAEATGAAGASSLDAVLERVDAAARDAVERTPDLLPVLKEAGVVDAGGRGFTLLLDAFLHVVDGRPLPEPEVVKTPAAVSAHQRGEDVTGMRYEVMYLLDATDETIPAFKEAWDALGDSIVVVGGEGVWNCHVHTNDVGAAIEVGVEAGRPSKIRVTDLLEQVEEERWVREAGDEAARDATPVTTAVVAVAMGNGVRRLLRSVGVQAIVAGGQSMNPSTAEILEAVEGVAAESVIVLPNNKNIVAVAEQVDGLTRRSVAVVPTHAVVAALAALVSYDPDADLETNRKAMTAAAERVRAGEVTQAVRDAAGVHEGDWLALTEHGVCVRAGSALDAATQLVEHLADDDSELVTVLVGADARGADTDRLRDQLGLARPDLELEVHEGQQPLYPYLIGVE